MTEALEKAVKEKEIRILDKMQVIKLLTFEGRIKGVLCLDKKGEGRTFLCADLV